jgi:hypothetical protein
MFMRRTMEARDAGAGGMVSGEYGVEEVVEKEREYARSGEQPAYIGRVHNSNH